jgi:divalent metal cation (Fe/Co/Zn/Cd) transporter
VVLFASHHGKKEADDAHPYGHQRFETAASLLLGVLLLAVGVGMLWSAFRKLEDPGAVQQVHVVARTWRVAPWWPKSCFSATCFRWPSA